MTRILDGKALATITKQRLQAQLSSMIAGRSAPGLAPGLATVLVGEDAASKVYVKNKRATAQEIGMVDHHHALPATTTTDELLALVQQLNANVHVHGILVQLPLPKHVDESRVLLAIAPHKDVDGFHPDNVARLALGMDGLVPCTPLGCLRLLQANHIDIAGAHAVVVGRSNIVGKPMAQLLLREHATVTIAHSRTHNLAHVVQQADIVIAAVGKAKLLTRAHIRPGAVVIDVGINRNAAGKLEGDVDFEDVAPIAAAITPVPGGVGPMTIAMLMENTLTAWQRSL
jgi:methylenetetrahydrofolate dehydrogenase (NADP+) / methenyltetrahydrofolate cyclohydrolase